MVDKLPFLPMLYLSIILYPLFSISFSHSSKANATSSQELEILVVYHIFVTIGNQNTTTFSDWIAWIE